MIAEALLAEIEAEAKKTRAFLEAVPEEKLAWKPHEKSMTLAQLAGHLAETPTWIVSMLEAELDFGAIAGEYKPFVPESREQLLTAFDTNCGSAREGLNGRDDAFMSANWRMRMEDKILMEGPRHAMIRDTTINHTAHHRGQLSVYLRLLDVPVPPAYGPTADFPDM